MLITTHYLEIMHTGRVPLIVMAAWMYVAVVLARRSMWCEPRA